MESIKSIYKIGVGPSSSHTMGPKIAAERFYSENMECTRFVVSLYGSLAATGKGHLTDKAIENSFNDKDISIHWFPQQQLPLHPNALKFEAYNENGLQDEKIVYSIGGGNIIYDNIVNEKNPIYPKQKLTDIINYCDAHGMQLWEYVEKYEDQSIWPYLNQVWQVMKSAVERGINAEGVLPGGLNLRRKAASYYIKGKAYKASLKRRALAFAYALAVAEENASGGEIVTAPTCGSCGVLPGVLYLLQEFNGFSDDKIIRAIATAGLIGNIVKSNASISGAEVGCQGEIGTACAMAAAASTQLFGGTPSQVEYSAEMGMEHHLGLTCDPVMGLVQVPCIERNAFAVARALDANQYAILSDGKHIVSFDEVVFTMNKTGHDLPSLYRETAGGGLAKYWDMEEKEIAAHKWNKENP